VAPSVAPKKGRVHGSDGLSGVSSGAVDPQTSAALIAAVSAGGVAVVGFITNLRTTTRTLDAARDQRLWEKRAEVYEEILAYCAYRQASRQRIMSLDEPPDYQAARQRLLGSYEEPSWFQMQARVIAFGSPEVEQAFRNARDADEACAVAQLAAYRAAQAGDLTDDGAGKVLELVLAAEAADSWLATIAHDQLTRTPRWSQRLRQRIYSVAIRHVHAAEERADQLGGFSDKNLPSP